MSTMTTLPEATFEILLAELEAGGTLALREPNCAPRDERIEDVVRSFCNVWMFGRKTPAAKSSAMFAQITIDDAQELLQAGALWIGSPDANPCRSHEAKRRAAAGRQVLRAHEARAIPPHFSSVPRSAAARSR